MTKDEINRTIAEHFGLLVPEVQHPDSLWPDVLIAQSVNRALKANFCDDLNAMRDAAISLDSPQSRRFNTELQLIVSRDLRGTGESRFAEFHQVNATAAQRAEAFLRTIGKWREDEHPIADPPKVCDTPKQEEQ